MINTLKQDSKNSTLPVQKGFWQDAYIGNVRQKMEELNLYYPEALKSEKTSILAYWLEFEYLQDILGENWKQFRYWFLNKATSPETITRCRRAMKESDTLNKEVLIGKGK